MIKEPQTYFKGLNSLRFFAAFLVIISHLEQNKYLFGIKNFYSLPFFIEAGSFGVTLFFVLSGFLITYLLLDEKEKNKTISLKKFYIRRILRIWPLYYLIIILGFFVLPTFSSFIIPNWSENVFEPNWVNKLMLYILILPNIAELFYNPIPYISQTWSIGVEEQFYLFWPLIIKYFKNLFITLLFIIFSLIILRNLSAFFGGTHHNTFLNNSWVIIFQKLNYFFNHFRIGSMAIGGIGALFLFNKQIDFKKIFFQQTIQILVYFIFFYFIFSGTYFPYLHHELYSLFFLYLILNISSNKRSVFKLENPIFNFLGKISYGLYMFHIIAIVTTLKLFNMSSLAEDSAIYIISVTLTTVLLSITLASLSYFLVEAFFLNKKKLFHYYPNK